MRLLVILALGLLLPWSQGCDPGFPSSGPESTISDEAFIETLVSLRRAAAQEGGGTLAEPTRLEVLRERSVTEEELRHFVQVHGENIPRMTAIWTEVEARLTGQDPDDLELDPDTLDLPEEPGAEPLDEPPLDGPGGPPEPGPVE
jgi:hypothetical protein